MRTRDAYVIGEIERYQAEKGIGHNQMATLLHMAGSTLFRKRRNPDLLTLKELRRMADLFGKDAVIKFI